MRKILYMSLLILLSSNRASVSHECKERDWWIKASFEEDINWTQLTRLQNVKPIEICRRDKNDDFYILVKSSYETDKVTLLPGSCVSVEGSFVDLEAHSYELWGSNDSLIHGTFCILE